MELSEILRRRRMVRSYRPEPVDQDALRRIVGVVHRAPSAGFSLGHRVVVVTSVELRAQIAGMAEGWYLERGARSSQRRRELWPAFLTLSLRPDGTALFARRANHPAGGAETARRKVHLELESQ
jgi:nitroreductase